jgi:hypothetical protein
MAGSHLMEAKQMTEEEIKYAKEIIDFFKMEPTIPGLKLTLIKNEPAKTLEEWEKYLNEQEKKNE